jgi:Transposase DDE domain
MTCRCPAGQVTSKIRRHGYERDKAGRPTRVRQPFQFEAAICAACPLRQQCYKPGRREGRQIEITGHESRIQAARSWQRGPEFERFRKERQVVEHRIARLVQLGVRQARYVGRARTLFQVRMAATVANLTLIAGLEGVGRTPHSLHGGPTCLAAALLVPLAALLTLMSAAGQRSKPIASALLRRQPVLIPALESAAFRPAL